MTPASRTCPRCRADLTGEAVLGLCPACLIDAALQDPGSATTCGSVGAAEAVSGLRVRYVGDYELMDEVARGGMGVIYKARQISLNRIVALKMIRSGELAGEDDVRRFHLEAEAAANLQHPNIVAVHEVGVFEGHHYFTMDFVEGRNLAQVANGGPLPARRAAAYVKTIAEAIHFAHQRGTLHRDLKPQNVLIDPFDQLRVTDFGLAKQTRGGSQLTMSGAVMGSPSYMPPEQARGRLDLAGPASDVYGIGAILYELLTGRAPFRGETVAVTLKQVVEEEPVAPSTINPDVPRDLETICLKCLEKPVERRYPTARALAEELGRFLAGEAIQARPAGALRKALTWSRRHRWLMVATGSAAFLALTGVAFGLWEQTRYLSWVIDHPGWTRRAGALTESIRNGWYGLLPMLLFPVLVGTLLWYRRMARGVPGRHARLDDRFAPLRLISPWSRAIVVFIGLAGGLCCLWLAALHIKAFVWEGLRSPPRWVQIWMTFYLSALLVVTAVREQILASLVFDATGEPPADLPEDGPVTRALYAGVLSDAIRAYGELTGAPPATARSHVMQLAGRLYQAHPDRFTRDPRLPAGIDRTRAGVGVLGIAIVLGLLGWRLPWSLAGPWILLSVCSAVFGSAATLARATVTRRRRLLTLLPGALVSMGGTALVSVLWPRAMAITPILLGLAAGSALVLLARRAE